MTVSSIAKMPKAKRAKLASLIASMKRLVSTIVRHIAPIIRTTVILFAPNIAQIQPNMAPIVQTMQDVQRINAPTMPIMHIIARNNIANTMVAQWIHAAATLSTIANNTVLNIQSATILLA